jgi:hypothetical protein
MHGVEAEIKRPVISAQMAVRLLSVWWRPASRLSDSLVAAFFYKYRYNFWRPETAIRAMSLSA